MLGKFNFDLVADDLAFLFYSKCSQSWFRIQTFGRSDHTPGFETVALGEDIFKLEHIFNYVN